MIRETNGADGATASAGRGADADDAVREAMVWLPLPKPAMALTADGLFSNSVTTLKVEARSWREADFKIENVSRERDPSE